MIDCRSKCVIHTSVRRLLMCLIALTASGQEIHPAFEAADVRVSEPASSANLSLYTQSGGFLRGDRYEFRNATMADLIGAAWGIGPDHVIGGPVSLDRTRFDVVARIPPNTTEDSAQLMLRALLADRFHLIIHPDTRPFAQYVLTTGKHPLLKRAAGAGETGCRPLGNTAPNWAMACHNMTMAQFANRLPHIAGDYFMNNVLADQTGLEGAWDFELKWTGRAGLATAGSGAISIFAALEKQLGLRAVIRGVSARVIVVDSVNENPAPNPAGVATTFRLAAAEFEAAAIKPSAPGSGERTFRFEGSQVTLHGFTLRALIKFAWGFQDLDVIDNDDLLATAPQLSGSERFDIVASRPAAAPGGPPDLDAIHEALRSLLRERFKLVTHTEERPVSVYALIASNPKLHHADLSNRSACRDSLLQPDGNLASVPVFAISCRNTTMAQLSEKLQPWAGAYIRHPVIDATGLEGGWDFTLHWNPPHLLGAAAPAIDGLAADPNGGLTLVEALHRQLGLRLKLEKHSIPVLVVDHAEPKPSEN